MSLRRRGSRRSELVNVYELAARRHVAGSSLKPKPPVRCENSLERLQEAAGTKCFECVSLTLIKTRVLRSNGSQNVSTPRLVAGTSEGKAVVEQAESVFI
jgi:hypothetical protein